MMAFLTLFDLNDNQIGLAFLFFFNKKIFSNFHKKNPLFFVILFITCFLILSLYLKTLNKIDYFIISVFLFGLITFLCYQIIYYWRDLKKSFFSFISFSLAIGQIFCLIFFYFKMPSEPIYLKNISHFTAFRYIFIGLIGLILLIFFLITKKTFTNPINLFSEVHKIFYSWNENSFLNYCSLFILKKLIFTKRYRVIYVLVDFISSILPKIITLIITFNVIFFAGDLRWFIKIIPFILITILLSHLQYYMEYFIEGNSNVIREWITARDINGSLIFSLTNEAKKFGLTVEHVPDLSNKWIQLSNLSVFFNYKKYLKILSLVLSVMQLIIWIIISSYILFFSQTEIVVAGWWQTVTTISKSPWHMSKHYFSSTKPLYSPPRNASYLLVNLA